jgi:hypothetical protein
MAASAAASALANNIFYQTGSLKKAIYQCKRFGFKGNRDIKIVKILIYGALVYGTTYKQGNYSSKPVS